MSWTSCTNIRPDSTNNIFLTGLSHDSTASKGSHSVCNQTHAPTQHMTIRASFRTELAHICGSAVMTLKDYSPQLFDLSSICDAWIIITTFLLCRYMLISLKYIQEAPRLFPCRGQGLTKLACMKLQMLSGSGFNCLFFFAKGQKTSNKVCLDLNASGI